MIKISKIDSNFDIYKKNVLVLFGVENSVYQLLDILKYNEIEIHSICDGDKNKVGGKIEGIPVISIDVLEQFVKSMKAKQIDVVVQLTVNITNMDKMEQHLREIGVKEVIKLSEALCVLHYCKRYDLVKNNQHIVDQYNETDTSARYIIEKTKLYDYYFNNFTLKQYVLFCLIPKTGDYTLINTFHSNKINSHYMDHTPEGFDMRTAQALGKKVKILTALRDPIAQNISLMYQLILTASYHPRSAWLLDEFYDNIFNNCGDIQKIFDRRFINSSEPTYICDFMERFKENIIDLSKYDFDKEKGYSIIKEGNVEICVYQLEKMNSIVNEISDWIGEKSFNKWVIGNEAKNSWFADSYKKAQNELVFTKEYFDKCYDDPWVKHFYSSDDIDKFKARWEKNLK